MLGGFLANLAAGAGIGAIRERVRPNPYAPDLTDQGAIATGQALEPRSRLRGGFIGAAGSDPFWYVNEGAGGSPIAQDVAGGIPQPPAMYLPGDPGADPSDPTVLRDFYRGPVVDGGRRAPGEPTWGGSTRSIANGAQRNLPDWTTTGNVPGRLTPSPRDLVDGREKAGGGDALLGLFGD